MKHKSLKLQDIIVSPKRMTKRGQDIDSLVESIALTGLINPIVISAESLKLISGYRRLKALKRLGIETLHCPEHFRISQENGDVAKLIEMDENIERSNPRNMDFIIQERKKIVIDRMISDDIPLKEKEIALNIAKGQGVSVNVVRKSLTRNKKASNLVKEAAIENNISNANINNLIKLSKKNQDALLPYVMGSNNAFSKSIVNMALDTGVNPTILFINETSKERISEVFKLKMTIKAISKYLKSNQDKLTYALIRKSLMELSKTIKEYQRNIKNTVEIDEMPGSRFQQSEAH